MRTTLLLLELLSTCQTAASAPASVTVTPSRTQFFEYEKFSVSCEQFGWGEWTVWRYMTNSSEPVLSQCGSGWGSRTSSSCDVKTLKLSDNGVYWCESRYGDSSNAVNITVTDKPAILQSPAHPVTEGVDVTLHCRDKNGSSDLPAAFFKTGSFIGMAATAHMTIRNFSKSDESVYKCHIGEHGESPPIWLLRRENSGTASLTVLPSSSQLFQYENLFLSCGNNSSLLGWRVFRATSTGTSRDRFGRQRCGTKWGTENASGCVLHTVKKPDSGIYWCESLARQRSNSVNIQIHNTLVILQSPLLPVMAGDNVTLCCKTKSPASDLPAMFYKDDSLIRTDPSGHMTIHQVSRSHEGVYKCHISGHGESPASWLLVRGPGRCRSSGDPHGTARSAADPDLLRVIRYLVVLSPYCISTVLMASLYLHRPTGTNRPVSMAMSPPREDDERSNQVYDDAMADVTTEYQF